MAKRYGLIYGDDYEKRQYWIQFVTVLEQSRGRRNHIIFMIITALIKELGLSDCNDLIMINTLERWAYDRLSFSGESKTVCRKLGIRISRDEIKGTHSFRRNAITDVVNASGGNLILAMELFGNSPEIAKKNYYIGINKE